MSVAANMESGTLARPDLCGQVAFIANGSEPVGSAIARRLASNGATVGLCGDDRRGLDALAAEIVANGGKALIVAPDRSGLAGIPEIGESIRSKLGNVHILVNNPPELAGSSLAELSVADFAENVSSTLTSSFALLREFVPIMRAHKYGRIVNVFSLAYLGVPGRIDVAAAYAGIFGLTRSAALETARDGITANSVVRGDIVAPNQLPDDIAKIVAAIPVKRIGAVEDVVHAIRYLVSPTTSYVTGQTLFVCGGRSVYFSFSV